jgi:hypothetical protein
MLVDSTDSGRHNHANRYFQTIEGEQMPHVSERVTIDVAGETFLRTLKSEIEFEVDFDQEAIEQIYHYTNLLTECYNSRLLQEQHQIRKFANSIHQQLLSSPGVTTTQTPGLPRSSEHPTASFLPETELNLKAVIEQLKAIITSDPKLCCFYSRSLRYEIVSLYILGKLSAEKEAFGQSLLLLRKALLRFKGLPEIKNAYVNNVELRLADLETIYEKEFGCEFDAHDEAEFYDEQGLERRLDNLNSDLTLAAEQLQQISRISSTTLYPAWLAEESNSNRNAIQHDIRQVRQEMQDLFPALEAMCTELGIDEANLSD